MYSLFKKFKAINTAFAAKIVLNVESLACMVSLARLHYERTLALLPKVPIAKSSSGCDCMHRSSPCWELVWLWLANPIHDVTTTVNSDVQLPC